MTVESHGCKALKSLSHAWKNRILYAKACVLLAFMQVLFLTLYGFAYGLYGHHLNFAVCVWILCIKLVFGKQWYEQDNKVCSSWLPAYPQHERHECFLTSSTRESMVGLLLGCSAIIPLLDVASHPHALGNVLYSHWYTKCQTAVDGREKKQTTESSCKQTLSATCDNCSSYWFQRPNPGL